MTQLEIDGVWKVFGQFTRREVTVLKEVSLSIEKGEVMGIVGPRGAGKSTLLQIMGVLARPTRGSVRYNGTEPFQMPLEKLAEFRNSRVGFVFQFHHLLPEFNATENVMMPLLIAGQTRKNAVRNGLLPRLGLVKGSTECLRGTFGLILANLPWGVHLEKVEELCRLAEPGGALVLAGFKDTQTEPLLTGYQERGWSIRAQRSRDSWSPEPPPELSYTWVAWLLVQDSTR